VAIRKTQLKLLPLRHGNGDFLDFEQDSLVCGIGLDFDRCFCTIRGSVGMLNVDSSLLVGGFSAPT
jgi:hypothetical protein